MILLILIGILFFGGVLAWLSEGLDSRFPRVVALVAVVVDLMVMMALVGADAEGADWIVQLNAQWIPRFGISFHLAADGLSVLMMVLTAFLGAIAIGAARDEITERTGFFYFNLLWTLAGVIGVFTALDLFLFFFFWEVMLIPMYLIIAIWGHENRAYAAMKFFLFTQVSGLLLLLAILCLAYFHYAQFGAFSFDYFDLQNEIGRAHV